MLLVLDDKNSNIFNRTNIFLYRAMRNINSMKGDLSYN